MSWKGVIKDILKNENSKGIPYSFPLRGRLELIGEYLMETLDEILPMMDEEDLYEFNREQRESIKRLRRSLDDALDEVNDLLKKPNSN